MGLAGGTAPATAKPVDPDVTVGKPDMPDKVLAEYRQHYADVPVATLYQRLKLSGVRKNLLKQLAKRPTFGGSWYDYRSGTWHVLTTDAREATTIAARSRGIGVDARVRVVRHSLEDLNARARRISSGRDPLSKVSKVSSVDTMGNRVVLTVAPGRAYGRPDPMVRYETGEPPPPPVPDACNTRRDCVEHPLRTGIVLWKEKSNTSTGYVHYCSLGFVAKATDGSLWALTAGHCFDKPNELWGHGYTPAANSPSYLGLGGQCIVPVDKPRYPCLTDALQGVDAARIKISNPWWKNNTYGSFGHSFYTNASGVTGLATLHNRAEVSGEVEVGEVACLSAWHGSEPGFSPTTYEGYDASDECGIIEATNSSRYHMVSVSSVETCMGDSGGGWLIYPNAQRWAAGLHHGHDDFSGMSATHCGDTGYFSMLPDVDNRFDANNISGWKLRVITSATPNGAT